MRAASVILAVVCFGGFAWAIRCFFAPVGGMQARMRVISILATLFSILHICALLWRGAEARRAQCAAVAFYTASLALFLWTVGATRGHRLSLAFSTDPPRHLYRTGPYRVVRHPFYKSYTLCWIAGVFATEWLWLLPSVIVMFSMYYSAARLEEAKFAASDYSMDYAQYRSNTGMFLPRVASLKEPIAVRRRSV